MRRFFSDTSFWNQKIAANAPADPTSREMLDFMASKDPRGFWINTTKWTIPIYAIDATTPRRRVHRRLRTDGKGMIERSRPYFSPNHPMGFGRAFAADAEAGLIPIPDYAVPDPQSDAHIALVDWDNGWVWDMWAAKHREDGEWESNTGMKYRLDGSGVFDRAEFAAHNGESIHPYGPGRAAGVPIIAGTIMYDELAAGRIEHRLGFATQAAALQRFVHPPACWTDGGWKAGLPEGAVVQLDPAVDVAAMPISPAAKTIALALQQYGAVCVDVAGGHPLYAEGLYGDPRKRSWQGILAGDELFAFKWEQFRVLKMENVVPMGMGPRKPDGVYAGQE